MPLIDAGFLIASLNKHNLSETIVLFQNAKVEYPTEVGIISLEEELAEDQLRELIKALTKFAASLKHLIIVSEQTQPSLAIIVGGTLQVFPYLNALHLNTPALPNRELTSLLIAISKKPSLQQCVLPRQTVDGHCSQLIKILGRVTLSDTMTGQAQKCFLTALVELPAMTFDVRTSVEEKRSMFNQLKLVYAKLQSASRQTHPSATIVLQYARYRLGECCFHTGRFKLAYDLLKSNQYSIKSTRQAAASLYQEVLPLAANDADNQVPYAVGLLQNGDGITRAIVTSLLQHSVCVGRHRLHLALEESECYDMLMK